VRTSSRSSTVVAMLWRSRGLCACLVLSLFSPAVPASRGGQIATVEYDHFDLSHKGPEYRTVHVSPGQFIEVAIKNLDERFTISWEPLHSAPNQPESKEESRVPASFRADDLGNKVANIEALLKAADTFPYEGHSSSTKAVIPHTPGNAGYVVTISGTQRWAYRLKSGTSSEILLGPDDAAKCENWLKSTKDLPEDDRKAALRESLATIVEVRHLLPVLLVLRVPERIGWQVDMAGALIATNLADEQYAAVPTGPGATTTVLRREQDREDKGSAGLAAFIHAYNRGSKTEWLALSAGIGMGTGSDLTFFAGPSVRLGDVAAISIGAAWGQIRGRPRGLRVGDPVTDPNVVQEPPMRRALGAYLAFTYAFLKPPDSAIKGRFSEVKPEDVVKPAEAE